ncbi:hypothetical protein BN938_1479 [Mucinivorans hirudinis]|uniref:Uncharacterized protein n=1 Tax=Mucinivorans hirudinis TaxID=1433126 RepID=A0A060R826_9BACT|nr:hypothetical protein BN938_1479 [Mucinivorans hirudinis]
MFYYTNIMQIKGNKNKLFNAELIIDFEFYYADLRQPI